MKNFFNLEFGLSGPSQPDLIQFLRTVGAECIQTGKGLCVKSPLDQGQLEDALKKNDLQGITVGPLPDPMPDDVRAFTENA